MLVETIIVYDKVLSFDELIAIETEEERTVIKSINRY